MYRTLDNFVILLMMKIIPIFNDYIEILKHDSLKAATIGYKENEILTNDENESSYNIGRFCTNWCLIVWKQFA